MTNHFIAIEGVIGVGKTTLARLLQSQFPGAALLLEVFEENPFLSSFYQDRVRYAFQTQLFFLLSRYHQQIRAVPQALQQGALISDYTFAKDELFAWLNLKDDELAMYGRVHAALSEKIPRPSLIVYLKAEHDTVMRRIALRDRPYERDMDPAYIQELAAAYDAWLSRLQDVPVLTVDVTHLDFLANSRDLEHAAAMIQAALARHAPQAPAAEEAPARLLQQGRLPAYQEFHRRVDGPAAAEPDLLPNFLQLAGDTGALGRLLAQARADSRPPSAAPGTARNPQPATVAEALADLMARLLRLANDAGIDLEQVYLERNRRAAGRPGAAAAEK